MSLNAACWLMWIAGTIVIVLSWVNVVTPQTGWFGFGLAIFGTLLSSFARSRSRPAESSDAPDEFGKSE